MKKRGEILYLACVSLSKLPDDELQAEAMRLSRIAADNGEPPDLDLLKSIREAIELHMAM